MFMMYFIPKILTNNMSPGIPAIRRVMFLYKNTKLQMWLIVSPSLHNN